MRKSIPKTLKNKVWDTYIGKKNGVGKCYCCKTEIDSKNFDCGHIVAVKNGGKKTVENMRPICSPCNKSMGTENMISFGDSYFPQNKNIFMDLVRVNTATISNYIYDKWLGK